MRILAIRGENLASLSGRFEVDLDAEPLRSTGLFAITGETGAGKSTILDAMCLALYGECPRLRGPGIKDAIPDVGDETLSATDPRAILRRGAASGWATVDFIADDGETYRAEWVVRRAREATSGKLQNVSRALRRLPDGTPVATQLTLVNAKVVELTGLSFDEFRRTVLLAQGDFDAFLVATSADRSALLEKVTGTAIYREISKRVFERNREAGHARETLNARRSAITPALSGEARTELETERTTLQVELTQLAVTLSTAAAGIETHRRLAEAQAKVVAENAALEAADRAHVEAEPERLRQAKLRAALQLRSEHDVHAKAAAATLRLTAEEGGMTQGLARLADERGTVATQRLAARIALEAADAVCAELEPVWERAAALDDAVAAAAREAGGQALARDSAVATEQDVAKTLADLLETRAVHTATRDAAADAMAGRPEAGALAARWPATRDAIEDRTRRRAQEREHSTAAAKAEAAAKDAAQREAELSAADDGDREALAALDVARATAEQRVAAIEADDPATQGERIRGGLDALRRMVSAHAARHAATQDAAKAAADHATAEAAHLAATEARGVSVAEADRASAALQAMTAAVERAEAAVSTSASELRRHLADGEPCPVCGATEHPIAADPALAAVFAELQAQRTREHAALAAARTQIHAADRAIATAELRRDNAAGDARKAADGQVDAAAAYDSARADGAANGVSNLPASIDEATDLDARIGTLTARQADVSAARDEVKRVRRTIQDADQKAATLRNAREARAGERADAATTVAEQRGAAQLARQAAGHAANEIAAHDSEIAVVLAAVGCPLSALDVDPARELVALDDIAVWWTLRESERTEADEALRALEGPIAGAKADLAARTRTAASATTAFDERRKTHEDVAAERAALLGGEATAASKARHRTARDEAAAADRSQDAALTAIKQREAHVAGQLEALKERLAEARSAEHDADAALVRRLTEAALDRAEFATLLAEGEAGLAQLTQRLSALDNGRTDARSRRDQRRTDLDALIAAGVPIENAVDLAHTVADGEVRRATCNQRIGEIGHALADDDTNRGRLAGLDAEIAAAEAVVDTWRAVNGAVGSKDGGTFAKIAQDITLGVLVERANGHLLELRPRYQLAKGAELALQVIDLHMSGEVRSTRSLSGGERFLVSLSLALALSQMGRLGGLAATLFIDEGFGSLDAESLDLAIDALEALQAQGRTIGVISHVEAMKSRIPVQVRVERRGPGTSVVATADVSEAA